MWASCPGKGPARAAEAAPGKGLVGETCFAHLHFMALVLVVALFVLCLRLLSDFPFLPCYAWTWRVALTARAQVKGSKAEPLLLYTDSMLFSSVMKLPELLNLKEKINIDQLLACLLSQLR